MRTHTITCLRGGEIVLALATEFLWAFAHITDKTKKPVFNTELKESASFPALHCCADSRGFMPVFLAVKVFGASCKFSSMSACVLATERA
mmetsp:Transcript_43488/g.78063  ORF Transcript_43488/g.78063 Transcript_43488/m.78063 type:complete len:90 (+) Transcript_43488:62-331(+)